MKVLCNTKHSTDKKTNTFWDEINILFEEVIAISKTLSKYNSEITLIDATRVVQSLWQHMLQLAVQTFEGIA